MKVHGQCHCGQVAFEADVDPSMVSVCHCTDCRKMSGSPYRVSARAPAASFRMLSGEVRRYIKTADSGNKRVQAFCGNCGSALYSCPVDNPDMYALRVGALDEAAQLAPVKQGWCVSALPWSQDLSELPKAQRGL